MLKIPTIRTRHPWQAHELSEDSTPEEISAVEHIPVDQVEALLAHTHTTAVYRLWITDPFEGWDVTDSAAVGGAAVGAMWHATVTGIGEGKVRSVVDAIHRNRGCALDTYGAPERKRIAFPPMPMPLRDEDDPDTLESIAVDVGDTRFAIDCLASLKSTERDTGLAAQLAAQLVYDAARLVDVLGVPDSAIAAAWDALEK